MKKVIDLGDHGEITILGEWRVCDCVSGYNQCWEVEAKGLVMNDWAENIGVPHGTVIQGTFWACTDDDETDPEKAEWLEYGFDNFQVVEISPHLVDALAEAVGDILADQGLTKEDLADPDTAEFVWSQAWKELQEGGHKDGCPLGGIDFCRIPPPAKMKRPAEVLGPVRFD